MFKIKKSKIFCIGYNKTGTTSVEKILKDFNYNLGDQPKAEMLLSNWYNRDFEAIKKYCKTATAFQDVPFSLPYTYILLNEYFPNSKFILTVRDSPEQWYNSIVKFHSKLWGNEGNIPTDKDLKKANYRYKGLAYEYMKHVYSTPNNDMYNREMLINSYNNHNKAVIDYFKSKPNKLIVINTSNKNDYFRLCEFLNKNPLSDNFPWENKTSEI